MKKNFLIIICVITVIVLAGCSRKHKFNDQESVAYTSLRYAIAQSTYRGLAQLDREYLDILQKAVKKFDTNSDWFDDYYGPFYGVSKDTDNKRIDYICNEDYCAKFTVKEEDFDYYLMDYAFIENDIDGYYIDIK